MSLSRLSLGRWIASVCLVLASACTQTKEGGAPVSPTVSNRQTNTGSVAGGAMGTGADDTLVYPGGGTTAGGNGGNGGTGVGGDDTGSGVGSGSGSGSGGTGGNTGVGAGGDDTGGWIGVGDGGSGGNGGVGAGADDTGGSASGGTGGAGGTGTGGAGTGGTGSGSGGNGTVGAGGDDTGTGTGTGTGGTGGTGTGTGTGTGGTGGTGTGTGTGTGGTGGNTGVGSSGDDTGGFVGAGDGGVGGIGGNGSGTGTGTGGSGGTGTAGTGGDDTGTGTGTGTGGTGGTGTGTGTGTGGTGGTGTGTGTGTGGTGGSGTTNVCEKIYSYSPSAPNPDIMLAVDVSNSMNYPISVATTRPKIDDLKTALTGILDKGAGKARFGWMQYPGASICTPGQIAMDCGDGTIPAIRSLVTNLRAAGGTPTGESLHNLLQSQALMDPTRLQYVVLLTDGVPTCPSAGGLDGPNVSGLQADATLALNSVRELYNNNIDTFVIGLGEDLRTANPEVLNAMSIGGGHPRMGTNKFYSVTSLNDLNATLQNILNISVGCKVSLTTTPNLNSMWVYFDGGVEVARDPNNGYQYDSTNNVLYFYGTSCDKMRAGQVSKVQVRWNC